VDGLIKALRDQDERVRMQAAWALGSIGDRRASDALAATLKDASPRVRRQAAWALGSIGR
jgi:HEAT repeat protein